MDLRMLFSMLFVMSCGMLNTVESVPAREAPLASSASPVRHVRTKRCSCATFLDKECVYFCHLDIIWVNTPERVVSYGLGNAPRKRRSTGDSAVTKEGPRCKCIRENDSTCANFCQLNNQYRYKTTPGKVILSAQGSGCKDAHCEHNSAAGSGGIKSMKDGRRKAGWRRAFRAAAKARLLLQKWGARLRHRTRAWQEDSAAS